MAQEKTERMFSRGKLGEALGAYHLTPFDLSKTSVLEYSSLHDPHLRKYFQRKDVQKLLRERNLVTEQNEVICSMKDVRAYHRHLEKQLTISKRSYSVTQKARMAKFLKDQEKGLVSKDMTLSEFREVMLEEELQTMRKLMTLEVAQKRKCYKSLRPINTEEEEKRRELVLMSLKVEEREALQKIERQVRHEFNREKVLRETQERRERQKIEKMERKKALHLTKLEKLKQSEASAARA